MRTVKKTWVISWNGGSWLLEPPHVITVLLNNRKSGLSQIKFDMAGPSGSSETYHAVVSTADIELYTDVSPGWMMRTVKKTWVISWNGGSWLLEPPHTITVLSNKLESGLSQIKFDMVGPSGSAETYQAVVPTADIELYTGVSPG